jgi:plastocyanin
MTGGPDPNTFTYAPTDITVACGGAVHITNNSAGGTHNMTPRHGGFTATGNITPTGTATVRMRFRGSYDFYCSLHPSVMMGTVHVT